MNKTTRFAAAEFLVTPEAQAEFITAAFETGDAAYVRDAVGVVARAHGMGEIAKAAGLNRESLYRALGMAGNPEFATMLRVFDALGLSLKASARPKPRPPVKKRVRTAAEKRKCRKTSGGYSCC